jgi:hypothetical protein
VVQALIALAMRLATVLDVFDPLVVALKISEPPAPNLTLLTVVLLDPLTVIVAAVPALPFTVIVVFGAVEVKLTLVNTELPGVEPIALLHSV